MQKPARTQRPLRLALAVGALCVSPLWPTRGEASPQTTTDWRPPSSEQPTQAPNPNPVCVTHRAEARFVGLGYNHIVTIENGCESAVRCVVEASSNPKAISTTVEAKTAKDVVVFRGSPAREFTASVKCRLP